MWARFKTSIKKDKKKCKQPCNVNDEYLSAVRTKSFADFFFKAQLMVKNPPPQSPSSSSSRNNSRLSEFLLNPGQEAIASLLESSPIFSDRYSPAGAAATDDLKSLLANYFDISAQASNFCTQLLNSLNQIQSNYASFHQAITAIDLVILHDPFSEQQFDHIHEQHSMILHHLTSKRKRIARKIKLIKFLKRASAVCITAACGILAAVAVFLAVHTLTALIMGPALLIFPISPFKRRIGKVKLLRSEFLMKMVKQLDVAAKGAYILNRDFDTMSRLVSRLQDEIEHNRRLIKFCLDNTRVSLRVRKEMEKCELGFRKQVEELEEHVYICLVTINRARALVVEEICKDG